MENTPVLHTEHLTLDRFTLEDVAAVRDELYTEAVCRNLFITPNKTTAEVRENIQWLLEGYDTKEDFHQWAVRENGRCVGRVMLTVNRRFSTGTVAYYLAERAWGKGYMTEILKRVIDFCFDDLGLNRVEADHFARNPASGKVMANRLVRVPTLPSSTGMWAAVAQSQVCSLYFPAAQRTASLEMSRPVRGAEMAWARRLE